MFDSFLNVFLNSIVMLLYYQYYYSFSFIYFVVLSFPCFIILALIVLSEFWCYHLVSFLMLVYFAAYFGQFLYFISFLSHLLYKTLPCSKLVYTHILLHVLCCFYVQLLTLNDSMPFYCFKHYFNDISMVTVFQTVILLYF